MSYHKAVIVPASIFERCKFDTGTNDILFDNTLPTDVKLKLYNQNKLLNLDGKKKQKTTSNDQTLYVEKFISTIHPSVRPFAKSILDKLQNNLDISWSPDGEITIESETYYGSNITEILKYILNLLVITNDNDIPHGATPFLQFLQKINIPQEWIKLRIKKRTKKDINYREKEISESEFSDEDEPQLTSPEKPLSRSAKRRQYFEIVKSVKSAAKTRKKKSSDIVKSARKSNRQVKATRRLIEGHGKINWISL